MKKLLALFSLFLLPSALLLGQNSIYVSPAGNNSNPGTLTAPWKTIQYALDHATYGTTICVMGGIYHENCIVPVSTSASGANITLRNYNDENAVMEGTGNALPLLSISNVNHFSVRGLEFRNSIINHAAGILISGKCNGISISDNSIHDIDFSSNASLANSGSHSFPILVRGDSTIALTNITIADNSIFNNKTGYSASVTLCGNVNYFTIEKNNVHDNTGTGIAILGHDQTCSDPAKDQARTGTVRRNDCYANVALYYMSPGLLVNGASALVIENNSFSANTFGLLVICSEAGTTTSDITVKNNCIFSNTDGGMQMGESGNSGNGNVVRSVVNNNTFVNNYQPGGSGELKVRYCDTVVVHSNLIYSNSSLDPLIIVDDHHTTTDLHNNLYFCSSVPLFAIGTTTYHNHNFFSSALTSDVNSLYADPDFSDITSGNFHLQGSSPAIDAGEMNYAASYNETDMDSMARVQNGRVDAGADEYGTAVGIVNPVLSSGTNYGFFYNGDAQVVNVTFYEKQTGPQAITLYSVDGRMIETKNVPDGPGGVVFNVDGLAPGTYVIYLPSQNVAWKFVR